jgi:hypothetical protein
MIISYFSGNVFQQLDMNGTPALLSFVELIDGKKDKRRVSQGAMEKRECRKWGGVRLAHMEK